MAVQSAACQNLLAVHDLGQAQRVCAPYLCELVAVLDTRPLAAAGDSTPGYPAEHKERTAPRWPVRLYGGKPA
jgi:hypothetical protein